MAINSSLRSVAEAIHLSINGLPRILRMLAKTGSLALLFVFIFTSPQAFASCVNEKPADYVPIAKRKDKSLFYAIKTCDKPTSYVMGTFHSDSPDVQPILDLSEDILAVVDQVALEVVITAQMQKLAKTQLMLHPSDVGLRQKIGATLFNKLIAAFGEKLQLDAMTMDRYKPWAIAVLAQYPKPEADGIVLDEKLQRMAAARGLLVVGLETLESQLNVFDSLKPKHQLEMLQSTLDDAEQADAINSRLKRLYVSQNLPAIYRFSKKQFTKMAFHYAELADLIHQRVLIERNINMVEAMIPYFESPTLVAVGALHLPGKTGILHLLEKEGYLIETVKTQAVE